MKKVSFSLLLALFVLLTSCRTVDYSTDGSITIRYEFINDTDYVCSIVWTENGNGAAVEQSIEITSHSTYVQNKLVGNTYMRLCDDGKTEIVEAKDATVSFIKSGCEAYKMTSPNDWWRLPNKEEVLDIPYESVYHFYLSDILQMSQGH
jgi:hypothetical protein